VALVMLHLSGHLYGENPRPVTFHHDPARTGMRVGHAERPVHIPRSFAPVLLAHSTVICTAGTTALGGGRKGVWGEPGTGAVIFRGRGRFRVPPVIPDWSPPSPCAEWSWSDPDLTLGVPSGWGWGQDHGDGTQRARQRWQEGCRATSAAHSARTAGIVLCGRWTCGARPVGGSRRHHAQHDYLRNTSAVAVL